MKLQSYNAGAPGVNSSIGFDAIGSMESGRRWYRSLSRFILLFTGTLFSIILFFMKGIRSGFTPEHSSRAVMEWSSLLNRMLGVKASLHGKIPGTGALILCNHRSYIDITVISRFIPCAFLAKAELESWPVLGFGARIGNTIFVNRNCAESRKSAREKIYNILSRGISVVVFPEGTTFEGPGVLPFKTGIFYMAHEFRIPIIPAAIEYYDRSDAWTGNDTFIGHFLRAFGKKKIIAGLYFGNSVEADTPELLREKTWHNVDRLLKEL